MKKEHVLFPSVFSKLRIRLMEGHFYCVHMIRFSEPTKNGSCERSLRWLFLPLKCIHFYFRLNRFQITMLLTFEIFWRARDHGKKFLKFCQTSFSGIVH